MRRPEPTGHKGGPPSATDRSLRVALDATPLIGQPTGVGVFCAGLLAGLAARPGLSVSAFAVSWRRRGAIADRVPPGVSVAQRAMPARPLRAAWRHLAVPPVEWFIGPADVVHGTNFVVPPARRAATVVTVHDLTFLRFPQMCDPSSLAYPALIRRAIRRGAWVHTDSHYVAEEVREAFAVDPDRVRTVHLGVPSTRGVPPQSRGSAEIPDSPGPRGVALPAGASRYVLAVGTAEPRKDLPGLVKAFDALAGGRPDVALVLVGPAGWGEEPLQAAISASRWRHRIVRSGWLADEVLAGVLGGAAVLAYPSVYEGFGFPPLEAMAAGVPVVASRSGSLPEVLGDGALMVPAGDVDALAEALGRVLDQTDLGSALVERGRRRAAQFTWEACAAGMAELYGDAARERGPRR